MISEFVASLRHSLRHSRMDPTRARYRENLRLDTRRDLEFRSYTRIFAWNRSGVAPTLQEQSFSWLESLLWASECFNSAATLVADEWLPPHTIFYGSRPRLPLLHFLQPAYHRVPRQWKTDLRAHMCFFCFFFGYNHGRDSYRLLDAETGRVAYLRDGTWRHPETPWITPIRAVPT